MSGRQTMNQEESRRVGLRLEAIRKVRGRDLAIRFGFGAGISLVAGLAGLWLGHRVGGTLLAFPAILPAGLTLVAQKEDDRRASVNALGATLGGVALLGFAVAAYLALPRLGLLALAAAGVAWVVVALGLYFALRLVESLTGRVVVDEGRVERRRRPAG